VGDAATAHEIAIRLTVNGRQVEARSATDVLLIDFLRQRLGLTGTKESCGVGVCGACTVLVDGRPVSACLLLAVLAHDREVWTVEGLEERLEQADPAGRLGRFLDVRRAFLDQEGLQCGICTPGMVVSAYALLQRVPHPTDEEIADWMAGNLCRCTGYQSILRSIRAAAGLAPADDVSPNEAPRAPDSAPSEMGAPEAGDAPV
jgi:aerobic carbon-monoxide dehydrogenase small subunit